MQDEIFPDEDDFGRIFRNNSVISAAGLPQFAAIMGNCVAGGAYLPVLCDKILMTEGSGLYLAGPSLVKAAIGQVVDAEELGGAQMHAEISGTVDFFEKDDPSCLKRLRSLVALLPEAEVIGSARPARAGLASGALKPAKAPDAVYNVVSFDGQKQYDARDLLASIVDANSIDEYKADYGKTLITAYARIGGHAVGIVANQRLQYARRKKAFRWAASSTPIAPTRRRALSWTATRPVCRLFSSRTSPDSWSVATRRERHHPERSQAGECGQQFCRPQDHGGGGGIVRRGQLCDVRQGIRSTIYRCLAQCAVCGDGSRPGVRYGFCGAGASERTRQEIFAGRARRTARDSEEELRGTNRHPLRRRARLGGRDHSTARNTRGSYSLATVRLAADAKSAFSHGRDSGLDRHDFFGALLNCAD